MKDKSIYTLHADVCKALAHAIRIEIIDVLKDKEMSFSEILEKTGGLKSNLSQHLSVMVNKGILVSRKNGQNVFFKLSSTKVQKACHLMREVLIDKLNKHHSILNHKK